LLSSAVEVDRISTGVSQIGVALFPFFKHFLSFHLSRFSFYIDKLKLHLSFLYSHAADVCKLVTCGENAICTPKKQKDGQYVGLCSCPRLHKGNALKKCIPVECDKHEDCAPDCICENWKCQNPCPFKCGKGAKCYVNNKHTIVCSCPLGTVGNPFKSCEPAEE
jgi:hypothetical protein